MTNEEKAREFLSHIIAEFNDNSRNRETIVALGKLFEVCFLSACEWKDQQFKEYLEKKIHTIESMKDIDTALPTDTAVVRSIKEIINELFEETEQDNSNREE